MKAAKRGERVKAWALLTFSVAFIVRLGLVAITEQYHERTRGEIHNIAISIAEGRSFSDPTLRQLDLQPTALRVTGESRY
jgi:hypothetical protein